MESFRKMALIPAEFAQNDTKPVDKQLSDLDREMSQILNADVPSDFKLKMYMHILNQHAVLSEEKKKPARIEIVKKLVHTAPEKVSFPGTPNSSLQTSYGTPLGTSTPLMSTLSSTQQASPSDASQELGPHSTVRRRRTPVGASAAVPSTSTTPTGAPVRSRRERFLKHLKDNGVSFNAKGELKRPGGVAAVNKSNMDALVNYVTRTAKAGSAKPVGLRPFLSRLKGINMPWNLIGNKSLRVEGFGPPMGTRPKGGLQWSKFQ